MNHAYMPIGPVGKPTELHLAFPMLAMRFTKISAGLQGADGVHAGGRQLQPVGRRSVGYLSHFLLNAYDANPVWTADPKRTVYRDVAKRTLTAGGLGSLGEKAAAAIADFIVVDMFANYCTGREDAKGAMAHRRAPGAAHLSLKARSGGMTPLGRAAWLRPGVR